MKEDIRYYYIAVNGKIYSNRNLFRYKPLNLEKIGWINKFMTMDTAYFFRDVLEEVNPRFIYDERAKYKEAAGELQDEAEGLAETL